MRTRRNAWTLAPLDTNPGTPWDPTLEWYSRAVAHMQTRPINDPTSWKYQAAIHEYDPGSPPNTEPVNTLPSAADRAKFWSQCQHQSWFFLPWHRVYLAYFEQIVSAAIAELGGPDDWALPYWNYSQTSNPRARSLPPAFFLAQLPDGTPNALRIAQRRPGCNTGQIIAGLPQVDLASLLDPRFTGQSGGGNPGFGGPRTGFNHGGGFPVGKVEAVPHGSMHMAVGGFMGAFNTAGLDPLFWLHHANIDRLWQVWQKRKPTHRNPTVAAWLTGQRFDFHDAAGAVVTHSAGPWQQTTTCPLPYDYDDVADPLAAPGPAGVTVAVAPGGAAMSDQPPEMVGATPDPIVLTGQPATVRVAMAAPTGPAAAAVGVGVNQPPAEVYVNIENITGVAPATGYLVYVNVPAGEAPQDYPERYAGLLPLFGLTEASRGDATHPADGLHYALDIGAIAQQLAASGEWDPNAIQITLVPEAAEAQPGPAVAGVAAAPASPVRIGRVSVYVS